MIAEMYGIRFIAIVVFVGLHCSPFSGTAWAATAHVAVASNFKPAMDALESDFERRTGHEIIVSAGATGKIHAQIVNGAPFDVFLAADQARPRRLEEDGVAVPGSRFTYAVGRLVLWAPAGDADPERLRRGSYRRLAMANPKLAPYGAAAMETLSAIGLDEGERGRWVFGENIGQAFAFVRTGNADLGFVALSQIMTLPPSQRGARWTPAADAHAPIRQDAALIARASSNPAALAFVDFLKSDEAGKIIEQFGYGLE